jgi:NAD(P)-dependent dehydrogenase (short-subunit alcohol dehydrogenase family)
MTEQGRAGPVALVTGAGRRIGGAIARDLAQHGWAVAIHYRGSRREAEALTREIEAAGGRAVALACDLAREAEVETLIPRAVEALGPLTCLVNNASAFEMDKIDTATRESWDRHLETNLRAPLVLSQAFARQLPESGGGQAQGTGTATGNIINMLDQRVWKLTPYFLSYTLAKSGLWTLTQTMALALAPRIRVNGIGPGPTLPSERQSAEQFHLQQAAVPLKRGPALEEIAATVRYILATPSLTGQMIALDGGEHLGWAQPARGFVARE